MLFLFQFLLITNAFALQCEPNQIFIREQWIESYTKNSGEIVDAHSRKAHCRDLSRTNYFRDSTNQKIKNSTIKFKKWKPEEKNIINTILKNIPKWLQQYLIAEMLRAETDGTNNPASSIALTKTLIIYDKFFTSTNKEQIITHELAHLTVLDLTEKELLDFTDSSGWIIDRSKGIKIPPSKLVLPDSRESVFEDYANQIEMYHFNLNELKRINLKSFSVIDGIIKKRGHK